MTTTTCVRGCTVWGQHLTDCSGECNGCKKRAVSHGKLCRTCFERLVEFLSIDTPKTSQNGAQGLVWARYWVDYCLGHRRDDIMRRAQQAIETI